MTQAGPMTAPTAGALDAAAIARLSTGRGEPDWLRDLRVAWWRRAEEAGWPSGQEEEWRRAPLAEMPRHGDLLADAEFRPFLPDARLFDRGVIFTDLATAAREHPDLVRRHLGTGTPPASHAGLWGQSLAAWTSGTFLYVPPRVEVDGTLIARITTPRADGTFLPHSLIVVDEGASVRLMEELSSPDGGAGWFGGTVDIVAMADARVRYANLQLLGDEVWNLGSQRVAVGRGADVTSLNTEVGSRVTKLGVDVRMNGTGGTSLLLGLTAAGDDQLIDINTVQDLAADHTTSDLLYLSALYERAHASFYGVTNVRHGTRQTSSYQECRNLLLSPQAGAEPIPVLEIEANDILRCGHGATAGALDPVQLFYAQSRGLEASEAERLIVRGFFEQVMARISDEPIHSAMLAALAERIGHADAIDTPEGSAA